LAPWLEGVAPRARAPRGVGAIRELWSRGLGHGAILSATRGQPLIPGRGRQEMSCSPPALACDLGALSREDQARRSTLASRVSSRFREVRETADGYAARLDAEMALARDAFDLILLEARCCPFLRLELSLELSAGPVWLRFGGGPGVKEFL